jgi:hypothetical protein
VLTRLRKVVASSGEVHGRELKGKGSGKLRVYMSALEA